MFGNSFSWLRLLSGISRGLSIARQIMPVYEQVSPIVKKMPAFFSRLNNITSNIQNSKIAFNNMNIDMSKNNNLNHLKMEQNYQGFNPPGPTFFQ